MWKYVLKRLLWMIAIVIGVAFVIFTILYFTPGDPAALMLGEEASMAERAEASNKRMFEHTCGKVILVYNANEL